MAIQSPAIESQQRLTQVSAWLSRPLCCRYAFAVFKGLRLPIRDGEAVENTAWLWAFGQFKQAEYEILGAWPAQAALAPLAHDLHERGIEHIKAIATEGVAEFVPLHPNAPPWPPAGDGLDALQVSTAIPFGHRRRSEFQAAAATAERVHRSLTRAIRQRAPFADEAAAATFLSRALEKADRHFYAT